jgi:cation:H+ antiporter
MLLLEGKSSPNLCEIFHKENLKMLIVSVLLFAVGLVLLIKGGDWFVDGATGLARRFRLPDIIVGATVVSIGTTLPEVMVSVTGALQGQGAMAYGNAIGSIICNTSLIAAISVACNPGPVNTKTMKMPVIFFFASAAVYCVAAYLLGEFPRWLGFVLLGIFVTYMLITVRQGLKNPDEAHEEEEGDSKPRQLWQELLLLVGGAALIAVGTDLLVDHGTIIAQKLGVPETVIALTFVALGTSLPELVTTITSLKKGHASLGIGNVIGANIFNLVLVSGASVALAPFEVPVGNLLFGINSSLVLDIPLMLGVMALLTVPALLSKKLHRWQGITLLCIYAAFCIFQFAM